jgi:hypothetical protein
MGEQTVGYCTSADRTRIAYAVTAGDKPAMLFVAGWPSSISLVAESYGRHLAEGIASGMSLFVTTDVVLDRPIAKSMTYHFRARWRT